MNGMFQLHKVSNVCYRWFHTFLTISGLFFIVLQPYAANVLHRLLNQRDHNHETHRKQVQKDTFFLVLHIFRIWVHSSHFYFHFSKGDHKKRPKCSKTRGPRWRYIYASWSRKGKMFKLKLFFIQISYLNVLCFFWTILSNLHPQANEQIHQENFGKLPLLKTPEVTTEYCCH